MGDDRQKLSRQLKTKQIHTYSEAVEGQKIWGGGILLDCQLLFLLSFLYLQNLEGPCTPPPLIPAPLILYQRYNQQTVSCIATTSILVYSEVWSLVRVALEEAYSHQIGNLATIQSSDFFKDVSFHVSFHVKFCYSGCCDFSINNPQNTCLVT